MSFSVYLSGEIHTDWREEIQRGAEAAGLDVVFTAPVTDHPASDAAGDHLGETESQFWRDHQSAKVNAIRTRTLIEQSDLVVVRFGDQYKQWNAAFDAGYCAAMGKPYVTLHEPDIVHPLKEVDADAQAWCTTTDQVVEILRYVLKAWVWVRRSRSLTQSTWHGPLACADVGARRALHMGPHTSGAAADHRYRATARGVADAVRDRIGHDDARAALSTGSMISAAQLHNDRLGAATVRLDMVETISQMENAPPFAQIEAWLESQSDQELFARMRQLKTSQTYETDIVLSNFAVLEAMRDDARRFADLDATLASQQPSALSPGNDS